MSLRSVFCLAVSRDQAEQIVSELAGANVSPADISVLLLDRSAGGDQVYAHAASAWPAPSTAPGTVIDRGLRDSIAGLGPLIIPGCPPLFAAGPLAAALGPRTTGGVVGGLVDFGVPELEAARYESKIKEGGVLLSLRAENPDQADRGRTIFRAAGAEDIRTIMVIPHRSGLRSPPPEGPAYPAQRPPRTSRRGRNLGARATVG